MFGKTLFKWEGQIFDIGSNKIKAQGENNSVYTLELNPKALHNLCNHPIFTKRLNPELSKGYHPSGYDLSIMKEISEESLRGRTITVVIE